MTESTSQNFENLINNFLTEGPENNPFSTALPDGELIQFVQSQGKAPVISTRIPTKKELQERKKTKNLPNDVSVQGNIDSLNNQIREIHISGEESDIFFHKSEISTEKTIFVNREKDSKGEVKRDLAIYSIDDQFIKDIRQEVTERVPDVFKDFTPFLHDAEKSNIIKKQIERAIQSKGNIKITPSAANVDAIADEIMGLGPLSLLTNLPDVTEIMVVDYDNIYVEMEGLLQRVENIKFKNREHLASIIERMVGLMGQSINFENPILDMSLSDGSRVNIVGPPITEYDNLYLLTIRRFRDTRFTLNDLLKRETISPDMYQYLSNIMKSRANVLLCGGTGSGKTSTLEALVTEKDPNECVITVEDTRELKLKRQNWRPMKSKRTHSSGKDSKDIDIRQLVKSSLRMRPDSIIVGETRDATAYDILFAMNSGHDGCCTTVHANNSIQALGKFEMLAKLAKDEAPPTDALREIVVECFDVVISIGRTPEGYRKIMSIDEVIGYNEDAHQYSVMNVFKNIQINSDPNQPAEYKFVSNPDYYTVEKLAFKMSRWGIPFVPPKDKNYAFTNVGLSKKEGNNIFILPENLKTPQGRKLTEWEKIERETDKARRAAQRQADIEKIKKLREAQKEEAKYRRRKQREQARREQIIARDERRAAARLIEKENKDKAREEKQAKILQEKKIKQEAIIALRKEEKLRAENDKKMLSTNSTSFSINGQYEQLRDREYKKLIAQGYISEDAIKEANLILMSKKLEGKVIVGNDPWKIKNLPKALHYKNLMDEGKTPEDIASLEGVSVNNILKYLKIVSPNFVKQYRNFIKTKDSISPLTDKLLAEINEIKDNNVIEQDHEIKIETQSSFTFNEENEKIAQKIINDYSDNTKNGMINLIKYDISEAEMEDIL